MKTDHKKKHEKSFTSLPCIKSTEKWSQNVNSLPVYHQQNEMKTAHVTSGVYHLTNHKI